VTAHDSYSVERSVLSNNAQVLTMASGSSPRARKKLVDQWLDYHFDPTSPSAAKVEVVTRYERPKRRKSYDKPVRGRGAVTWAVVSLRCWPCQGYGRACRPFEDVAVKSYERLLRSRASSWPTGSSARLDEILSKNLRAAVSIEDAVGEAEFIEESVPEIVDVKHRALASISAAARPDAVIGTNTSTIPIALWLKQLRLRPLPWRPFLQSGAVHPRVELIPHAGTEPRSLSAAKQIIEAGGKQCAQVRDVTVLY